MIKKILLIFILLIIKIINANATDATYPTPAQFSSNVAIPVYNSSVSESKPQDSAFKDVVDTFKAGDFINKKLMTPLATSLKKAVNSIQVGDKALKLFKAIFFIEVIVVIANFYLNQQYNSIVPTLVVKCFFYSAIAPLFVGDTNLMVMLADIAKTLTGGQSSTTFASVNFDWFNDGSQSSVFNSTQNGLWDSLDKFASVGYNSILSDTSWSKYLVLFAYVCVMFFIYIIVFKIAFGILLKCFEWVIGTPIAFFMIAAKGHSTVDHFFSRGVKYLFHTILDFCILMALMKFGGDLVKAVVDSYSVGSESGTVVGGIILIFSLVVWSTAVMNYESIVSAISMGSPQFSSGTASGLISTASGMGKAISTGGASAVKAGITGVAGIKTVYEGYKNRTSQVEKEKGNVSGWDRVKAVGGGLKDGGWNVAKDTTKIAGGIGKQVKTELTTDRKRGLTTTKKPVKEINKLTGKEETIYKDFTTGTSNALNQELIDNSHQWIKNRAGNIQQYRKFKKENNIGLRDIMKMGLYSPKEMQDYMNSAHDMIQNINTDLQKYNINTRKVGRNGYVGKIKTIPELKRELEIAKSEAEEIGHNTQKFVASKSEFSKFYNKSLQMTNNIDEKINVLNNWLKEGSTDFKNFDFNGFNKQLDNLIKITSSNPSYSKSYDLLKSTLGKNLDSKITLANNNNFLTTNKDNVELNKRNNETISEYLKNMKIKL